LNVSPSSFHNLQFPVAIPKQFPCCPPALTGIGDERVNSREFSGTADPNRPVHIKEYVDHVSGDLERRRTRRQNDNAYRELMADAARRAFDGVLSGSIAGSRDLVLVSALQQFSPLRTRNDR
jgi:hypothetical protein